MSSVQVLPPLAGSPEQCNLIVPTIELPSKEDLRALSPADRRRLRALLREPFEYVEHEQFERPDAEKALFGDPDVEASLDEAISEQTSLTTAQEVLLFTRFNYARMRVFRILQEHQNGRLPMDRAAELLVWAGRVATARSQLATANMPLVLAMAKRTRLAGLDFSELVSEGNLALLRSIDKFDCSRGYKFSTYACRAILKSFSRVAMRTSRYRVRFPTEFDPALETSDLARSRHDTVTLECLEEIRDILQHNRAELTEMEQTVIRERFALEASSSLVKPKTLEEVGEMIGVTKERVRQIQNKALRKIRMTLESSYLAA